MSKRSRQVYEFGVFRLDVAERLLLRDGEAIPVTPKAFDTLTVLVQNSGHIVSKDELMSQVWPDSFVEETNLAQNISTVRKALGERPDGTQYIETVPKRGYRFIESVKAFVEEGAESPLTHRPLPPSRQNPYSGFSDTEVQLAARQAPATVPPADIDESRPDTSESFPDLTIDRQQSVESRILRSP